MQLADSAKSRIASLSFHICLWPLREIHSWQSLHQASNRRTKGLPISGKVRRTRKSGRHMYPSSLLSPPRCANRIKTVYKYDIVSTISERYRVDALRIYAYGKLDSGVFTALLACQLNTSSLFPAFVPISPRYTKEPVPSTIARSRTLYQFPTCMVSRIESEFQGCTPGSSRHRHFRE